MGLGGLAGGVLIGGPSVQKIMDFRGKKEKIRRRKKKIATKKDGPEDYGRFRTMFIRLSE